MTEHERIEAISEARIFAIAAPLIRPLIERRKKDALARLMQAHRAGRSDTATLVAEVTVLSEIEHEINQKELTYRTLEEQHGTRK